MMAYPQGYEWLGTLGALPRTIIEALPLIGVQEVVGKGSNRSIMAWRDDLNQAGHTISGYSDDDIPWCGLFAAFVTFKAGKNPVEGPLWARNWATFGTKADKASLGDVLVFSRPGGGGHVGFYIAEDAAAFHVIGGNQGNRVSITRIAKTRCLAVRRPVYNQQPASVRPYVVKATGGLSGNEA
jgi:uncharacterized protein (TIGR02594 family)